MPDRKQLSASRARQRLYASLRGFFGDRGFEEVETPIMVPTPGMEPHIAACTVPFVPETDIGLARTLYLHTSPEYAMKRLLAEGTGPLFQICKVFRNGEVSAAHNPEFTLLEFYRPNADYRSIMEDLESALARAEVAVAGTPSLFSKLPYQRLTVREAIRDGTGIDIAIAHTGPLLREAAEAAGIRCGGSRSFEDVFFQIFLEKVEPTLGVERPTFLIEYPAAMASLARLKADDATVAERFELYARGTELANGFSELTDAAEQRRRFEHEQAERSAAGRPVYPVDERFLSALGRMPPAGGVAVGLDRILMRMLDAATIDEVLLFPAREFV